MSVEERIACFRFIRDIPYKIGLTMEEQDYCCSSKSVMLERLLNGLGLQTRPVICRFDWTQTPLPSAIISMPREGGETHMFLEVLVPEKGQWVKVDPAWDAGLESTGFGISQWDGLSDTLLAVEPLSIMSQEEGAELLEFYADPDEAARYLEVHRAFHEAVNQWLSECRSNPPK